MKAFPILTIFCGCLLLFSCKKGEENQPHHNTTYVWGKHYWTEVWPADRVAASADSVLVDYVFLMSDGISWEGSSTTLVIQQLTPIFESVSPQNRHKIRGAGILQDVSLGNDQTYKDSLTLAQMGFVIKKVR